MKGFDFEDISLHESAFKVYVAGELDNSSSEKDRIVGILLSCIPELSEDIDALRIQHYIVTKDLLQGLKRSIDQHIIIQDEQIIAQILFPDRLTKIALDIRPLLTKYKLSLRWTNSLLTVILYDFLFVPWKPAVEIELNSDLSFKLTPVTGVTTSFRHFPTQSAASISLAALINPNLTDALLAPPTQVVKKLVITVSERMSPTALSEYIKNSKAVKSKLAKLPITPHPKLPQHSNSLYWGHLAWAYKEFLNPTASMNNIEKWLEVKFPENTDVPDSRSLATYYKRFIGARNNFLP